MKKKTFVYGAVLIFLSIGIFFCSALMGYFEYYKCRRTEKILATQVRQAELFEEASASLEVAMLPLDSSIKGIVDLREFTILDRKPLYNLGNSFVGLQKSIRDVQASLKTNRDCFRQIVHLRSAQEAESDMAVVIMHVLMGWLIGLAVLVNGIFLYRKE